MTQEQYQRVKALFHLALERAPGERAAFLEKACADDGALRSEVQRLLALDHPASGFMDTPALVADELMTPELKTEEPEESRPSLDPSRPVVGRSVGPYRIVREIGRGGMGAVYLAERADDAYEKQVAVKLVTRGLDAEELLRRFRTERQILATLDHPYIAKLLDGGTAGGGVPYFVMDYVEGCPIDSYCDQRRLPTAERLQLFRAVCAAVSYAHQHHVVHRDLKPSNILVTAEGVPKLLDFGIAKVFQPQIASQAGDPTAMLRPMTPAYASPEQVRGEAVTPASDVYSLGVLLYELLTGHRPYASQTGTPHELERAICEAEPERPSTVIGRLVDVPGTDGAAPITLTPASVSQTRDGHPDRLRRRLAGDVDNILLMALRKEPERRYGSVERFAEDIRRHLEGLPIVARKDTLVYRSVKFIKRNTLGVVAATLILALLIALVGLGISRFPPADRAIRSVAVLPLANLSGDRTQDYFADGMTEELITELAQIRALRVISRTSAMQFKEVQKPLPEIARQLHVDALVQGGVLRSEDRVRVTAQLIQAATDRHLWAKTYERDLRDILTLQRQLASAIAQEIKVTLSPEEQGRMATSRPVDREAYLAYLKGRHFWNTRTRDGLNKAIVFFQQAVDQNPRYALAYAGLADSYVALSFYLDAPSGQYFPRATAAATKALQIDDTLAEAHVSLASTLMYYDWDWPGAEREFRRGLDLNPSHALGHRSYASYLSAMGRLREALDETTRSQELDPLSLSINTAAGRSYYNARQYDQAIAQYRKALEIDPMFDIARQFLGKAYALKGLYREAANELQRVGSADPEASSVMGFVYAVSGKASEARRVLEQLQAMREHYYVPPWILARVYAGLGENDQAFAGLEQSVRERDERLVWLKVDPMLDNLRSDRRFGELLRRLRFPE
jgi:serine/threonine protein kinase/TolB-like protein